MDFLKRHYEKVILLGLFVFFIGLMYMVQTVINSTREVTAADLALPKRTPDYTPIEKDDNADFNTGRLWDESHFKWDKMSLKSDENDFVAVIKMACCPFCKKRKTDGSIEYTSVIPLSKFSGGQCPECGGALKQPWSVDVDHMVEVFKHKDDETLRLKEERLAADEKRRQEEEEQRRIEDEKKRKEEEEQRRIVEAKRQEDEQRRREAEEIRRMEEEKKRQEEEEKRRQEERDRDGDGIINEDEERFGMDSNDAFDARYDNDGDGFSNIFELEKGFWPNNPLDHPPLWWRLKVKEVRKFELDVRFMALNDSGSKNKKDWMVQFNHPDPNPRRKGRMTSSYLYIDSTLQIDGKRYRVAEIERIITEKKRVASALEASEKGEVIDKIDESRVIMVEVAENSANAEKLIFVINQPAYSNDYRPVLVDTGNLRSAKNREIVRRIGENFRLGLFQPEKESGEKLTRKQLLKEVRTYRVKSVDAQTLVVMIEEVLPPKSKEKPQVFKITKDGMIPAKQIPIKKVQSQGSSEEDVLKQDSPVVSGADASGSKKKDDGKKAVDPNAPRKPLIGVSPGDGSPRPSMFSDPEQEDGYPAM